MTRHHVANVPEGVSAPFSPRTSAGVNPAQGSEQARAASAVPAAVSRDPQPSPMSAHSMVPPSARGTSACARERALIEALLGGVARLVQGQRRFAEEFGLSYDRVFGYDFEPFNGRDVETVLSEWAQSGVDQDLIGNLETIFDDLYQHHAALLSVMDVIARRTIKYFSPELTPGGTQGINRHVPVWRQHCQRHESVQGDARRRYSVLVAPGVAYGYVQARERLTQEK